ncbi:hypothetical protein D3C73_1532210 [compost metagenome]
MRDQHNALLVAVFKQVLVVLHSLNVGRLDRHEHQHEVGAAHANEVGVVLGCKVIYMLTHGFDVVGHSKLVCLR